MGIVLDIMIIAIMVLCVVYGAKKGFFRSLMFLATGLCALLIAYTFTPMLSHYINESYIVEPIAGGIETTFLSIAENADSASEYDKELLLNNSQFVSLMENAGFTGQEIEDKINVNDLGDREAIARLARTVAEPIAKTVSDSLAFIIIFIIALIVLRIITAIIGAVMKLPVLKELDAVMGWVFGIVSALLFAFAFVMMTEYILIALETVSPGTFNSDIIESSVLFELISKINPISAISKVLNG